MSQTIQPLKPNWKIDEDAGFVPDQIRERVRSEDNYTWGKGFPLIKRVLGRLGKPILE